MKSTSKICLLFIVLVVTLTGTACGKTQDVSGDCTSSFTTPGSYENTCGMEVSAQAGKAEIRMTADLQAGTMDWKLTDPSGKVMWESSTEADGYYETQSFENPATGMWRLTINTHEAQGTYDVDWVGK